VENVEAEADTKSVFVKNVEYKTDQSELREHFASCGTITRITIKKDGLTGHSLGYNKMHVI